MNIKEAGYEMLVLLSVSDRNYVQSEGRVIERFLERYEFEFFDIDSSNINLQKLDPEEIASRFNHAANAFRDQSTEAEQADFIAFAYLLIEADNMVSREETKILYSLANSWGLDPTLLVEDKTLSDYI